MTKNEFHKKIIILVNTGVTYAKAYQYLERKHRLKYKEPLFSCYREFIDANYYYRKVRKLRQNNI